MFSHTEENYLKSIYALSSAGQPVLTNDLAQKMGTRAATVTDMLKKLSRKKLIIYEPYYGVSLTLKGRKAAVGIVRKHRLWESFLVNLLGFKWDEVHDMAEELEHIRSVKLIDKLDSFLGHPTSDPHGDPIPDAKGRVPKQDMIRLPEADKGKTLTITGVINHTPVFLQYMEKIGVKIGNTIRIVSVNEVDESMKVAVGRGTGHFFSRETAQNILVTSR